MKFTLFNNQMTIKFTINCNDSTITLPSFLAPDNTFLFCSTFLIIILLRRIILQLFIDQTRVVSDLL